MAFGRQKTQKVQKIGHCILVKRDRFVNGKKIQKFQREGELFATKSQAEEFVRKAYGDLVQTRIQGVRISATPLEFSSDRQGRERA